MSFSNLTLGQEIPFYNQESLDSNFVISLIAEAQYSEHIDSAYLIANNALSISRKLNFGWGILQSLALLAELNHQKGDFTAALRYGLEALNYLEKQENYYELFTAYSRIGSIYQQEKLYEKALEYYQLAEELPLASIPQSSKVELHRAMGHAYKETGQIDSALFFYNEIISQFEKTSDTKGLINIYQQIVFAHSKAKNYKKALEVNLKIRELVRSSGDKKLLCFINNNIGYNYNLLKDYPSAIRHFLDALALSTGSNYIDQAVLYNNLGIAYNNLGDFEKSIEYLREAQKHLNAETQTEELADIKHLIATIYLNQEDIYNALQYNNEVLRISQQGPFPQVLSKAYNTAALIHQDLYEYEKALDYYKKHLALRDSFQLEERLRQQNLLQQQFLLERSEKEIKLLLVNQEVQSLTIQQLETETERLRLASEKSALEASKKESELKLLKSESEVRDAQLKNQQLEALRVKNELAIARQQVEAEKKDRELKEQAFELAEKEKTEQLQKQEIALLETQTERDRIELLRQSEFRQFVTGLVILLGIILVMIIIGLIYSRRANQKLSRQKKEIEESRAIIAEEKEKSEELLLNILPLETASELKANGVATPKNYEKVSVLFTDFSNFTQITASMTPERLISELNECFIAFDEIIEKYGLEKIKTIGDSYMAAGGIPQPNDTNPADAIMAALEIQDFMNNFIANRQSANQTFWETRIGIHTGPIIAGVVGRKKFAYDIWGDTVNTASRMESSGVRGKVNISQDTYELIKDQFQCTFRGEVEAKHKGKIGMYFVESVL